ncbi:hypothetical protein ABLT31_14360 [Ammoniphilus sp. 3BR4]
MSKLKSRFFVLIAMSLLIINGSREYLGYHKVNALLIFIMALLFAFVAWAIYSSRMKK